MEASTGLSGRVTTLGPPRPLFTVAGMAVSRHPCRACSFSIVSSLSPDILPPSIFSRISTTVYS